MQERKRLGGLQKNFTRFERVECARGQNSRKVFVRQFGNDIKQIDAVELALTVVEQSQQMRVGKLSDVMPAGEMEIFCVGIGWYEFDSGFIERGVLTLG